ncbi:uncharacterized protein TNCV_3424221 [Trichonephila clavipes]|nr:uncharacterized protein TNCV_3424221 [Trichonephila clavipes]
MVRRGREEKKGERGHRVTYVISVKKLDNYPRLRLVNLPIFRLGVLFPQTREHYQRSCQLQYEHYGVDKIALAAKSLPASATEVQEVVDLREPMNSDSEAEILLIKISTKL